MSQLSETTGPTAAPLGGPIPPGGEATPPEPTPPGEPTPADEPTPPDEAIPPGEARPTSGYLRRVGTAGLILAALAAGRVVTGAFQADDSISAPFLRTGTVGTTVSLRYADVTAGPVRGSSCVFVASGLSSVLRTPGVFVVVPLTIVAKDKPADLRYAAVRDRQGRTFLATGSRSPFAPGTAQPGLSRYASVVVEVPQDAVAGAHLRVALDGLDQRRDDMADIDLGLTAAQAAEWARSTTEVTVPDAANQPPAVRTGQSCADQT